jgi:predicted DNA-binding transcriptional regulator AlpA
MTKGIGNLRSQSQPRRGLRRAEAAIYVGVSITTFDKLVARKRMPQPKRIGSAVVWDQHDLDLAFEALPTEEERDQGNPWDEASS